MRRIQFAVDPAAPDKLQMHNEQSFRLLHFANKTGVPFAGTPVLFVSFISGSNDRANRPYTRDTARL